MQRPSGVFSSEIWYTAKKNVIRQKTWVSKKILIKNCMMNKELQTIYSIYDFLLLYNV